MDVEPQPAPDPNADNPQRRDYGNAPGKEDKGDAVRQPDDVEDRFER